jgi:hypothetical protein
VIKLDDGQGVTGGAGKVLKDIADTLGPEFVRSVLRAAEIVRGQIVLSIRARLNKDPRGQLQQSYKPVVHEQGVGDVSVGVYSNLPYAQIHESGGTIVPRTVRHLAVPFKHGLMRSQQGMWPRHFPKGELQLIPRAGKSALLVKSNFTKKGVLKSMTPMFSLVSRVRIKATHYLSEAATAALGFIDKSIRDRLDMAVTKAGAK